MVLPKDDKFLGLSWCSLGVTHVVLGHSNWPYGINKVMYMLMKRSLS